MSNSIDRKVVEARFDNNQFKSGVKDTLNSLDNLNRGLQLKGAGTALNQIADSTSKVANGFHVMRIAAYTAIATIAHQATLAGERFISAFTIDPLTQGLDIYQTKLNSIQTILANTGLTGQAGLDKVNHSLAVLNKYSNQTIYSFGEMAKNIGTFTAAGVGLNASVSAIKGIANLAAISGSNSQQASTAMYQLSQALAAGTVKLMDWNSVVNAGMGGKVFQNALMQTARVHGIAIDQMVKKEGSFRNTLQDGWLSSKILTETLNKFTGDLTDKQLKAQGYTEKQIKSIQQLGKTATDAATKVKTIPQLFDVLKETVSTGWAKSFELIIGDLGEAKDLFTGINNVVGGFISNSAKARNKVLGDWKALGGRTVLIDGIKKAFQALGSVLKPIHDAFREVFPPKTGQDLYNMTKSFRDFMSNLKIGADTANNLKRTFAGFFAVLDIGWQIVKAGIKFIADLFSAVTKGEGSGGGFLGATANIGDFLVALDNAIKKGQGFTKFFDGLLHVLQGPINLVKALASALFGLFSFKPPSSDSITGAFHPLTALGHAVITIWDKVMGVLSGVAKIFGPLADGLRTFFSSLGNAISQGMGNINYDDILHTVDTVLFGGLLLLFKKFVDKFKSPSDGPLTGFVDAIKSPFNELTTTLSKMQDTLRATTLLQIAAAIGIMAASVIGLSHVDAKGLTRALTAMTVMFGQLFASIAVFQRMGGVTGLTLTSTGLIVLAGAIRVLVSSVTALGKLSWNDLAKGLTGVTVLLGGLAVATRGMETEAGGMITTGAGLILLAAGIRVLVNSVTQLSGLSWGDMAKGLVGVAALLASLAIFSKMQDANAGGIAQGAGLILLAAGIKILAGALIEMSTLSWAEIARGLVTLAGSLLIISSGVASMQDALGGAAALLVVAAALRVLTPALQAMGDMGWAEIAKGLVTLAGSLLIIAVGIAAMEGSLPGAAALLVVAAALTVLTPILTTLGSMSWGEIAKGLVALAGVFVILAGAGILLTPLIPTLLGLGAAITLMGVGIALVGAGVLAFSVGLTALSAAGAGAAVAIVAIVSALAGVVPAVGKALALGVIAFATAIASAGPALVNAIKKILLSMITAIGEVAPKLIDTFAKILIKLGDKLAEAAPKLAKDAFHIMVAILDAFEKKEPELIKEGVKIVVNFLNGLSQGMPKMVRAAANLIVSFLEGLAKNSGKVIKGGADVIIAWIQGIGDQTLRIANAALDAVVKFVNGLAEAIRTHTQELNDAGKNLAFAIADGMTGGLASKVKDVAASAVNLAKSAVDHVKGFLGIGSPSKEFHKLGHWCAVGLAQGLVGGKAEVKAAWQSTHDLIKSVLQTSQADIDSYTAKLKELKKNSKQNADAIANITKKLNEAKKEHKAASNAMDDYNKHLDDEYNHLDKLGKKYDENAKKLDHAMSKLHDAKQARDDYNKSIVDQYKAPPDITVDTTVGDYTNQLKYKLADVSKFVTVLQKLRGMGLDDLTYRMLLSKGTDALPFAEALLQGGKTAVNHIDTLDKGIKDQAVKLGSNASQNLYQAGVDAAQGVVDGLKSKRHDIEKEMRHYAHIIASTLKHDLKIKSPSQVMAEIGSYSAKGLVEGFKKSSPMIDGAAGELGKTALESLRSAISQMRNLVDMEDVFNPTITPVLDLSSISRDAPRLVDLLSPDAITVDAAYLKATYASQGYQANQAAQAQDAVPVSAPGDITFIQNNNSPKALSQAEIYRNTKNQLSVAKGALTARAT